MEGLPEPLSNSLINGILSFLFVSERKGESLLLAALAVPLLFPTIPQCNLWFLFSSVLHQYPPPPDPRSPGIVQALLGRYIM